MADPGAALEPGLIPVPEQTPLYHALERARYDRQARIRTIEERTGRRLIAYVAGGMTSISAVDIPPFVDILDDIPQDSDLDLLLHTPGGDVDQAERIVLLCRKRVGSGCFRVIVPDSAKSAGTLIAIAADSIVMGEPSELGPIDPQVTIATAKGEPMIRPAQSFLDGLRAIVDQAEDELSAAYFPLLDKLDPALIDFCRKALQRSEQFAEKFLARYMLKDEPEKARQVAHALNDVREHLSHGAVIDAERALELGLKVDLLAHDDDLWQAYWRLYCDIRMAMTGASSRLYEGRKASLLYNGD
ncbi:MAG: SDH family Clp fold serine proteinase [Conexibacter sp.]